MRSYPFIEELFKNVLLKSKSIGGRFHVCPRYGLEINTDQLGEVMQDLLSPVIGNKYPLALMMPPRCVGNYIDKNGEWERYRIVMFFLTTTYYTGDNQFKGINPNTLTSTHTVLEDWHDMKRSAVNFLRVLNRIERDKGLVNSQFRLVQTEKVIDPISHIGADRASGVRLDFSASIFIGCDLEDYASDDISSIIIPIEDSHPEHKL